IERITDSIGGLDARMPSLIISHLLVIWLGVQRLAWCAERASTRERFKVVIAPLICKRICLKGQCQDTCEQGNNTTLIGENGQSADTLTGPGFRVVVCPLTCMNGGVCSSRTHCLCPPGFTGRLCQFPLRQMPEAQAARGNKQPVYTLSVLSDGQSQGEQAAMGRPQLTQTHSVFTLPLAQGAGHHSSEVSPPPPPKVQFNVRVHHTHDTSVVIRPLDQFNSKPPHKTVTRLTPQTQKPRGRCFQETTPKQACSSTPLPVLTNQEDCCGSPILTFSFTLSPPTLSPNLSPPLSLPPLCPPLSLPSLCPQLSVPNSLSPHSVPHSPSPHSLFPHSVPHSLSPHSVPYSPPTLSPLILSPTLSPPTLSPTLIFFATHLFLCACKPGFTLDRTRCVESPSPVEQAQCFLMATDAGRCEHALPTRLSQEMCCCTVGKAWGSSCERCPQDGTASFSKICPAGKGYFLHSVRETVAFPPQIHTSLEQEHKQEGENPTPPPIIRLNPDSDPLEVAQTQVSREFHYTVQSKRPSHVHIKSCNVVVSMMGCTVQRSTILCRLMCAPLPTAETDECRLNRNLCGHGECVNVHTGYKCECYAGYRLHPQRNACVDDDECDAEPCGHGRGICINTEGSYRCRCLHGYKLLVYHGKLRCLDVNECSKPDVCGQGSQCVNLPGSYKCDCHKGFRSKSQRQPACEDINECLDPSSCPNEQCENTPGSYECVPCFSGHQAQGGVCYDVNECQKRGVCPNGRCENLPGTYRCLCNEGFLPAADSKGCRDIDECEDERLCANGRCVNTEGSFQCQCYPGYQRTQEGSHCEDINECERPSNCQRGRCINSMGSYRCECQKGYMLVGGRRCQDIDECAIDRGLCQPHGVCENRQGSYVCVCKDGFILSEDKHSCEEIEVDMEDKKECYLNLDDTVFCDSVLATNVTKQECCCSIGVGWGDHCEIYPCPVYHSSEFHSLCPVGRGFYQEEGVTEYGLSVHIDIDECVLFSNEICKEGRCMNTQPGYECYCQQGFYYDSNLLECIDVNECHDESLCTNGQCKNTRGSFYCTCNSPWTPDASNKKCVIPTVAGEAGEWRRGDVCFLQVDEDLICSHPRNGLVFTYSECCCHYGRGWGPECRTCPQRNSGTGNACNIFYYSLNLVIKSPQKGDSSEEDSDECSCANGRCVRSYLSTMCDCNTGFRLDHSHTRCTDIDECAEPGVRVNPCKNARCVNSIGSFKCYCKNGFVPARRPNMCVPGTKTQHVRSRAL
uniref:Latent transforming growth factor beta binding protein 3 n=1 Tax=Oncorhynchus mykiss TaxID=8022 RepID=A0A8C7UU45_ONCMY